jgi:Ca-activated chloride channel family protein
MNWLYGEWAWVLLAIPAISAGLLVVHKRSVRRLNLFILPAVWRKVMVGVDQIVARRRILLSVGALVLLAIAALRPQFGTQYMAIPNKGQSILLAIDTSQSMESQDLTPSRLAFAKRDLVTLMEMLKGDRIGLITFAGTASLQCPLTIDYIAAKLFIDDVQTGDQPIPGTNLAAAIRAAIDAFQKIPGRKTLIIYSDGETFEGNYEAAAVAAKTAGIVIHTVGIGTKSGGLIPVFDEEGAVAGYKTDQKQNEITTQLNETALKEIATMTGGRYIQVSAAQAAAPHLGVLLGKAGEADYRAYLTPQRNERYVILALIALGLLLGEWVLMAGPLRRPGADQ